MASSDVARFLREKYSKSLSEVESHLPASISPKFHEIRDNATTLSISSLYDLHDVLAEWRIFADQRKGIQKILRRLDLVRRTKDRLSRIEEELKKVVNQAGDSSSSRILRSPWDRFTFYEPDGDPSNIMGFDEHEEKMVDWLLASGEGFKCIGIYGMGGSGKTALVKKVLINPIVRAKFKHNVIWACLSDLTSKNDMDIGIVHYLLDYLGFDSDSLAGNLDEDWLREQLERKLLELGNYVIVFDDVWHCNSWFNEFCHKLATSKIISYKDASGAVIVTSRIKEVAEQLVSGKIDLDQHIVASRIKEEAEQMVGGKNLIHLNPLDYKNTNFLKELALQNTSMEDDKRVEEIVPLCHGLAVAAKTLPLI